MHAYIDSKQVFRFTEIYTLIINSFKSRAIKYLFPAPPTNLTIALENEYVDGVYSTINCTANMNPNNTMLFLVGKETTGREPTMAPTINVQTFVEQSNDCSPKVRVVYPADFTFLRSNSILACVAFDKDYGQNFTSEYKTPSIIIIN